MLEKEVNIFGVTLYTRIIDLKDAAGTFFVFLFWLVENLHIIYYLLA